MMRRARRLKSTVRISRKSRKLELVAASSTLCFSLFAGFAFISRAADFLISRLFHTDAESELGTVLGFGIPILITVVIEFFRGERLTRMLNAFWQQENRVIGAQKKED
jgi:hypothetical protein